MKRNLFGMISVGSLLGLVGALLLFVSESIISNAYAEIHWRTYAFFFLLYAGLGLVIGSALGVFLHLSRRFFQKDFWRSENDSFLPAIYLAAFFFIYGSYFINEKLTAGVGMFAPLSLLADALYLGAALALFKLTVAIPREIKQTGWHFVEVSVLPLFALVATNLRFFAWQPPVTQTGELFLGLFSFGLAGLAGAFVTHLLHKVLSGQSALVRLGGTMLAGVLLCAVFIISAAPSANSFFVSETTGKSAHRTSKSKNIIWIVMDTARWDHISLYGGERQTTPNLDEFAKDALVFNRAIATAPWTLPSHASMFTGMFPSKHAAHFVDDAMFSTPLLPENVTLAEILGEHGYETAAVCANNAGLSRALGCSQGFQYYFDARPLVFSLFWGKVLLALPDDFRVDELWINEVCLASEINPVVESWLGQHNREKSFFLFINYMEPHGGIAFIPEPYDSMYGFSREKQAAIFEDFDADEIIHFKGQVTAGQRAFWTSYVHRKITFMDDYLGKLFAKLKAEGLYEDSIIIVNSDHGELFGEHNSFGHNTDLYNELIHVPMMVKYPQTEKTGRSDQLVQTVDIMPEVLSYLGIEIPPDVQGQPFAEANHQIVAELFQQQHNAHAKRFPDRYYRDLKAIYANVSGDSLKYIWASDNRTELFDLSLDPDEEKNVVREKLAASDTLQSRLIRWEKSFAPIKGTGHTNQIDKEELEKRLRSLGYIK